MLDKKDLTERDICTKYITPALTTSGWNLHTQIREEVQLTAGRVIVRGKMVSRGEQKRADYVLFHKANLPIAVIEAKDNNKPIGQGMQQALKYAEMLNIPFAFSSNGDGFIFHDATNPDHPETELPLGEFPSPALLWRKYCRHKGIPDDRTHLITQDYYSDGSGKMPRYYQINAINQTLEAIAQGRNRLILVMATGTGKTFTAFQIIWRLWKSETKKRILFLADRNILVDQTKQNDFAPFGAAMTKIKQRQVDKSYEIYLSLYQAVTGTEETQNIYKQFSPDFFDLIVIDECHRGSAAEDSAWRDVLTYFRSATQIGLTATPKETKDISNTDYFGEPIYTYSLAQGIEDGFLAPYKVIRLDLDRDLQGWRPNKDQTDKYGTVIPDRIYNQQDFDRTLVLEQRTKLIAAKIMEFLRNDDPYAKTIVFCEDTEHADRMRHALVNASGSLGADERRYIMRITGDDPIGKAELANFIDPESTYPVVVTTSQLMTTGVDAQTCKLIVLDQRIQSMTQFKQIIGRGTRLREDHGKYFFTIMDFKKATELFADPDFDGDPVQIYQPSIDDPITPPDDRSSDNSDEDPSDIETIDGIAPKKPHSKREKLYVYDVDVRLVAERRQYYGRDGKLITESLRDYTRKTIRNEYTSLDTFLKRWQESEQREAILEELGLQGVMIDDLVADAGNDIGTEFDLFDLICHIAFDAPPLSRRDRANNIKAKGYFAQYATPAKAVLEALLDKYADEGVTNFSDISLLNVQPINQLGTALEIVKSFGGKTHYHSATQALTKELYQSA
jgi:type I restriction enzyme, R subunit